MKRWIENALLLLIGVSTVLILANGTYTRYVKPSLLPYLAATAALLIVLAFAATVRDLRRRGRPEDADDHAHSSAALWLLVVPILLLGVVHPPALTTTKTASSTVREAKPRKQLYPPLPNERAPEVGIADILRRIARDPNHTVEQRLITVIGFTVKEPDGRTDLGRVAIICCAADAYLAKLRIGGPAAREFSTLPDKTWVRVEGRIPPGQNDTNARTVPVLHAVLVTPIPEPSEPYTF